MARPNRPRRSRGTFIPLMLLLVVGSVAGAWYGGLVPNQWQAKVRAWLNPRGQTPQVAGEIPPPEPTAAEEMAVIRKELAEMPQSEPPQEISETADELAGARSLRGIEPPEIAPAVPGEGKETDIGVNGLEDPFSDPRTAKAGSGVTRAVFEEEGLAQPEEPTPRPATKPVRKTPARKTNSDPDRSGASNVRHVPATASVAPEESELKGEASLIDMNTIQGLYEKGDIVAAHRELSRWFWKEPSRRAELRKQLDESAQQLYFAPKPLFEEPYVIQPGDQLQTIARKHRLTWEYVAKLNKVEPRKIRAGQKLKLTQGPFGVLVSISRHELIVHQDGSFVKSYKVGLGKDGSTPLGTFKVQNKEKNPTYYGPPGIGVIKADDPQNPLGERWIDIGDSYGIHGTIDPDSIGKNESRGCVRMLNSDVEEVYDFLIIGSEVRIVR